MEMKLDTGIDRQVNFLSFFSCNLKIVDMHLHCSMNIIFKTENVFIFTFLAVKLIL